MNPFSPINPNKTEFFGIIRTYSDLIRGNFFIRINPRPIKNQSQLILTYNSNESGQFNETEFFGFIRIDSDRPDSFGLKVRIKQIDWIHSD